jgi:hypothetical protein
MSQKMAIEENKVLSPCSKMLLREKRNFSRLAAKCCYGRKEIFLALQQNAATVLDFLI